MNNLIWRQVFKFRFSSSKIIFTFNDSLLTRFSCFLRSSISLYFLLGPRGKNIKKWKTCWRKKNLVSKESLKLGLTFADAKSVLENLSPYEPPKDELLSNFWSQLLIFPGGVGVFSGLLRTCHKQKQHSNIFKVYPKQGESIKIRVQGIPQCFTALPCNNNWHVYHFSIMYTRSNKWQLRFH